MRILGFDNLKQEYVYVVLNSFGTNVLTMSGPARADSRIDVKGSFDNPVTGWVQEWRTQYETVSPDRFILYEYPRDVTDKEYLGIEATYTRRRGNTPLIGAWEGMYQDGQQMVFEFRHNRTVRWRISSAAVQADYELKYRVDTSTSPYGIELFGFPDGPLAGRQMFGIIQVDGATARLDLEPAALGSVGSDVRPGEFTGSTLTLRRVPNR